MPKIVAEFLYKYKGPLEAATLPAIVVLVGLSAFGLGRLSAVSDAPGLIIRLPDGSMQAAAAYSTAVDPAAAAAASAAGGAYVGSKSGTKYYLPACSGVGRIKEENKVWFATVEEAQAAGYAPAANCLGL